MTKKLVSFDDQAEPGEGLPAAVKAELKRTYGTKAEVGEVVAQVESVAAHSLPRSLVPSMSVEVDVNEAVALVGEAQVDLTTYVGGTNAVVHPSLLFFDEGWNGYRYWMAYTPYNGGDPQVENPSIAVSNDGEKWVTPPGLTNPIEPSPPGPGYLADPVLFMTPDGATMNMVFKVNDARKQLVLRTSTDGVAWTSKQVILDNTYEDVSPAILWDQIHGYRMWTIVYDPAVTGGVNTMYVRTAADPAGPWSAPVACTASGLPEGALSNGAKIWHIDIKRVGQEYHAVMTTAPDAGQPAGVGAQCWFGKSTDGLAWTYGRKPIMPTGNFTQQGFYKAAILPKLTPAGLSYDMWYSGTGEYRMYKTRVAFDRTRRRDQIVNSILAARTALAPWVFADDFNRADSTTGLGVATTGQTWTKTLGGDFGIQSGRLYLPAAANSRAVVNVGASNVRVGADFPVIGAAGWVIFRYVDGNNLWRFGHSGSGVIQLHKIVAGTLTDVSAVGGQSRFNRLRDGDRLEVEAVGSRIALFLNGIEFWSTEDSANLSGTSVGVNADNTTVRMDNITVRAL